MAHKSMLLTPRAPRAGPTGGDGVALPAGTISLKSTSVKLFQVQTQASKQAEPQNPSSMNMNEPRCILGTLIEEPPAKRGKQVKRKEKGRAYLTACDESVFAAMLK